jgi:hypothetical protein
VDIRSASTAQRSNTASAAGPMCSQLSCAAEPRCQHLPINPDHALLHLWMTSDLCCACRTPVPHPRSSSVCVQIPGVLPPRLPPLTLTSLSNTTTTAAPKSPTGLWQCSTTKRPAAPFSTLQLQTMLLRLSPVPHSTASTGNTAPGTAPPVPPAPSNAPSIAATDQYLSESHNNCYTCDTNYIWQLQHDRRSCCLPYSIQPLCISNHNASPHLSRTPQPVQATQSKVQPHQCHQPARMLPPRLLV